MRPFSAASIVLYLFLLACFGNARKEPEEYWNTIMNGEAMPQVVKDLLRQIANSHTQHPKFLKNFDAKQNVIIYHSHVDPRGEKSFVEMPRLNHGKMIRVMNELEFTL